MRLSTLLRTSLLGLCVLSAGCVPFLPVHDWPGPLVANEFATDVDWEGKLTDGTVRRGTQPPCGGFRLFDPQPLGHIRTVFVERLTFWKGRALIGAYEGAKVEALGAQGGVAVLDETGLRRVTGGTCSRVFNMLDRDVRVTAHYADGSTASLTLRPCELHVWTGLDPIRPRRTREHDAVPTRLTITRDGAVIRDLDERAIRKTFKWHLRRAPWPSVYTIGASGISGYKTPPKQCLQQEAAPISTPASTPPPNDRGHS